MSERTRFSDEPRTLQILNDFALRLLPPGTSLEDVVLSQVRTQLQYATGELFWYNLAPRNFSVRECDPHEEGRSPVNGLIRSRRVIFSICDEAGNWHEPIGTTSILKDILGLTDRELTSTETFLLDTAHQAQQQTFYDEARGLSGYAERNGLNPGWFTEGYLSGLDQHDPVRAVLERILNGVALLDRVTLKHLKKAQGSGQTPHAKPSLPISVPVPSTSSAMVTVSAQILNWLRPLFPELAPKITATSLAEARRLLDRTHDYQRGQYVQCTLALLAELRHLTGMALTETDFRIRHQCSAEFTVEQQAALARYWPILVSELNYRPEQALVVFHNACQNLLLAEEHQALLRLLSPLLLSEQLALSAIQEPSKAPDLLGFPNPIGVLLRAVRGARVDDAQQQAWAALLPLVEMILAEDSPLLNRVRSRELTQADTHDLLTLLQTQPPLSRDMAAYAARPEIQKALPAPEQQALRLALQRHRLPLRLAASLNSLAHRQGLDPETFEPYALFEDERTWLLTRWLHVSPFLGADQEKLLHALRLNKYTAEEFTALHGLAARDSGQQLPEVDRLHLLETETWQGGLSPRLLQECLNALRSRTYSIQVWMALNAALRTQEEQRLAVKQTQQHQRETHAVEMQRRLVRQMYSQYPKEMQTLEQLTPARLLSLMPKTFDLFQRAGQRTTAELREMALRECQQAMPTQEKSKEKRRLMKRFLRTHP